jgi:hypothetical protein
MYKPLASEITRTSDPLALLLRWTAKSRIYQSTYIKKQ